MRDISKKDVCLSICFPTYNDPQKVAILLDCLSKQDLNRVEIVIRDDSLSDDTEKIVKKYNKLPIRYFRGEKEGFDAAILFLAKMANGEYFWWVGNDLIEKGVVAKIKKIITESPDVSFIWLNGRNKSDPNSIAIKFQKEGFFNNKNEIIELDMGLLIAGLTVIKKEIILPLISGAQKYKGLGLMGFYFALGAISYGGSYYFIDYPYIISEPKLQGEARLYDPFQMFTINFLIIAKEFEDKFNKKSFKKGIAKQFRQICHAVLVERAMGFKTGFGLKTPKIKLMFKYYWSFKEFWLVLPFFLMPRFILKYLYEFFKFLRSKKRIFLKIFVHIQFYEFY